MNTFQKALDYVFANEGGFDNIPEDHGGATRYGITIGDAMRWRKRSVSVAEMRVFPIEEAKQIYEAWYWKPVGCDRITSPGVAICVFDIGVVCGISTAARFAQKVCIGTGALIKLDGEIGHHSIKAINAVDPAVFIKAFAALSENKFRSIVDKNPTQTKFLKGWLNRAHRLLTLVSLS